MRIFRLPLRALVIGGQLGKLALVFLGTQCFLRPGPHRNKIQARVLCATLKMLGPLFIKLGQLLSTRADMFNDDLVQELSSLQDRAPAFSAKQARARIEKAFQRPIDEVFTRFSDQPVASASLAQVHLAVLRHPIDGIHAVAVKVLRPGIERRILDDLTLLRLLAQCVVIFSSLARRLKLTAVVAEISQSLGVEFDLLREAAQADKLRAQMGKTALTATRVLIPRILWLWCRRDVMVMEEMHGLPVRDAQALRQNNIDLKQFAKDGVLIFYTQIFHHGYFHGDMHPGNVWVSINEHTFGKAILLDFGIMGSLSENDKNYLAHNFLAFFRGDYRRVAELHIQSGWANKNTNLDEFEAAIRAVCMPYFGKPLADISIGEILLRLFETTQRFGIVIQPQLVLMQKTLLNVEGMARNLDPELNLWETALPFLEDWLRDQRSFKNTARKFIAELPESLNILLKLPKRLDALLKKYGI